MRTLTISWSFAALLAATRLLAQGMMGLTPEQEQARASCLGLTVQEYRDWYNPTHGEIRQPNKEERARQEAVGKKVAKVPRDKQTACNQAAAASESAAMAGRISEAMAGMEQRMSGASSGMTEAPGKTAHLSADVAADLAAGRTVVRDIDWVAGQGDVSATGSEAFHTAMSTLAPSLVSAGGRFSVDFFLDKRYDQQTANQVAEMRMKTLRDALPGVQLTKGKVVRDADPRLELAKAR